MGIHLQAVSEKLDTIRMMSKNEIPDLRHYGYEHDIILINYILDQYISNKAKERLQRSLDKND
jgi:hypothetical protein